jgi:hypothetical protein
MSLKFQFLKDENIPADDAAENKRKKDEMLNDLRYNLSKMSDAEIELFLQEEFKRRGKVMDIRKIWDSTTQGFSGFTGISRFSGTEGTPGYAPGISGFSGTEGAPGYAPWYVMPAGNITYETTSPYPYETYTTSGSSIGYATSGIGNT